MYTLPHLTAQQTLLPQNLDDGDDHGLWHAPTVATSHVSDTLPQQQKAGGTRAALRSCRKHRSLYFVRTTAVYVLVGFAAGESPSPDGLVLSDPASSCLGYGAVAMRSTACGRSFVVRLIIIG